LGVNDRIRIAVAMVLVRDVDVRTGVHVIPDLEVEVPDDVAATTDHAPVTDAHHWIRDHLLARHHPGRDADVGADQRVFADSDPALAEDGTDREGQAAAVTEEAELPGEPVTRPHCALPRDPPPGEVDEPIDSTVGQGRRARTGPAVGLVRRTVSEPQRCEPGPLLARSAASRHAAAR
jgi:hypothetical protein